MKSAHYSGAFTPNWPKGLCMWRSAADSEPPPAAEPTRDARPAGDWRLFEAASLRRCCRYGGIAPAERCWCACALYR
jgi:hypothetical protein